MIKKWLRKWLEVPEQVKLDEYVTFSDVITETERFNARFFENVFGEKDGDTCYRMLAESYLSRFLKKELGGEIEKCVSNEKFIDDFVERINRKQIK